MDAGAGGAEIAEDRTVTAPRNHTTISRRHPLLLGAQIYIFVLMILGAAALMANNIPEPPETEQPPAWEKIFYNPHDEAIMLLICLGIIPIVAVNFRHLRKLPDTGLLLASFGCMSGSAVLTVAEGFVFGAALNWGEHLLLACSAVLLAVWCGRMAFGSRQEGF